MNFDEADALNEAIRAIGIRHRALAIAALAPFGIHPGHKLLLQELETAGPCTQAQLAAASGYEPPTITWCELAEHTVAGLTSTPFVELEHVLADLATSLSNAEPSVADIPRYVTKSDGER
jgi:hypothetical protein